MTLAYMNHWRFRVVGYGPVPTKRIYNGDWSYEPITQVPQIAQERYKVLTMAGLTFKGLVIAHEVPQFVVKEPQKEQPKQDFKIQTSGILPALGEIGLVVGTGLLAVMGIILQAILIDPAIICVCKDPNSTWLEILTYYE